MDLSSLKLRNTTHSPYTNKADALTFDEIDTNFILLADAILGMANPGKIDAYSDIVSYSTGDYVVSSSTLYRCINPTSGKGDPASNPTDWVVASIGELLHQKNKDTELLVALYSGIAAHQISSQDIDKLLNVGLYSAKTTIASADILSSNTTPVTLISGVANKIINPVSVLAETNNPASFTAYATHTTALIQHTSATKEILKSLYLLQTSAQRKMIMSASTIVDATSIQLVKGDDLVFKTDTGDPTAGNFDITFQIVYQLLDASY